MRRQDHGDGLLCGISRAMIGVAPAPSLHAGLVAFGRTEPGAAGGVKGLQDGFGGGVRHHPLRTTGGRVRFQPAPVSGFRGSRFARPVTSSRTRKG